jgi:hypothetical protein
MCIRKIRHAPSLTTSSYLYVNCCICAIGRSDGAEAVAPCAWPTWGFTMKWHVAMFHVCLLDGMKFFSFHSFSFSSFVTATSTAIVTTTYYLLHVTVVQLTPACMLAPHPFYLVSML